MVGKSIFNLKTNEIVHMEDSQDPPEATKATISFNAQNSYYLKQLCNSSDLKTSTVVNILLKEILGQMFTPAEHKHSTATARLFFIFEQHKIAPYVASSLICHLLERQIPITAFSSAKGLNEYLTLEDYHKIALFFTVHPDYFCKHWTQEKGPMSTDEHYQALSIKGEPVEVTSLILEAPKLNLNVVEHTLFTLGNLETQQYMLVAQYTYNVKGANVKTFKPIMPFELASEDNDELLLSLIYKKCISFGWQLKFGAMSPHEWGPIALGKIELVKKLLTFSNLVSMGDIISNKEIVKLLS